MISQLNTYGTASRTLWPAVERNFDVVEAALEQAVSSMSAEIQKQILRGA
jgi:hypothetical protein